MPPIKRLHAGGVSVHARGGHNPDAACFLGEATLPAGFGVSIDEAGMLRIGNDRSVLSENNDDTVVAVTAVGDTGIGAVWWRDAETVNLPVIRCMFPVR